MDFEDGIKPFMQDLFTKYKKPKPPKISKKLQLEAFVSTVNGKLRVIVMANENDLAFDHKDCERLEKFFRKCSLFLRGKKF